MATVDNQARVQQDPLSTFLQQPSEGGEDLPKAFSIIAVCLGMANVGKNREFGSTYDIYAF